MKKLNVDRPIIIMEVWKDEKENFKAKHFIVSIKGHDTRDLDFIRAQMNEIYDEPHVYEVPVNAIFTDNDGVLLAIRYEGSTKRSLEFGKLYMDQLNAK